MSANTEKPALPEIGYLCSNYPAISHTFVLREVEALRRLGARVTTFSIHRAPAGQLRSPADREAFATTATLLPARPGALALAQLTLLLRAPGAYIATLLHALSLAPRGARGRLWQAFYFLEATLLWRLCRQRGIRHLHAHQANAASDVALLCAHLGSLLEPNQPWSWSFTMHGPTEFYDRREYRLREKVAAASFVVCISEFARSQLMGLSEPDDWPRLHVIHVGVPIDEFSPSAETAAGGEANILYLGRLVPDKGQAVLLEAVALLARSGRRARVVLAGEGPLKGKLEALATRLGIADAVSFPGALGQDDLRHAYKSAAVFCLPSFAEGVPVVLMEAMAMRVPVISTRIMGIPELIDDGENGLLVSPGRADELAAALERLLSDREMRVELGARGCETVVREFDVEKSAIQLLSLFRSELAGASLDRGSSLSTHEHE